jgi:hypothetical protein
MRIVTVYRMDIYGKGERRPSSWRREASRSDIVFCGHQRLVSCNSGSSTGDELCGSASDGLLVYLHECRFRCLVVSFEEIHLCQGLLKGAPLEVEAQRRLMVRMQKAFLSRAGCR